MEITLVQTWDYMNINTIMVVVEKTKKESLILINLRKINLPMVKT